MGFASGLMMMGYEMAVEHSEHLFVYGVALILTGLPIARGVEKAIDLLGSLKK